MATNYKIRLKRFNGTDYDILNLLSENIIMDTGNSLQSDIIPNTNGMLKNNDGIFEIANLGNDYTSIDDTLDSSVVKTYSIDKIKNLSEVLYLTNVSVSASDGDIVTINDTKITSNHVVAECVFDNPSAITNNVTWITSNGSLILNGNCIFATTVNIVLVKTNN